MGIVTMVGIGKTSSQNYLIGMKQQAEVSDSESQGRNTYTRSSRGRGTNSFCFPLNGESKSR